MKPRLLIGVSLAAFAAVTMGVPILRADQAQPRQRQTEPQQPPRTATPRSAPDDQRAKPRPPEQSTPAPKAQPKPSDERRGRPPSPPPPRVVPPAYYAPPHRYYFPPVSLQRGYYYHPYFGFYFGPYYGPFYPYPGPFAGPARYAVSAIRARVRPVDTEVYVNGYFAGLVDDFDGLFQRLYLPVGEHDIEFRLAGYETWRQRLYLQPGDTRDLVHVMRRLLPGESADGLVVPGAIPDSWVAPAPGGDRPASPFGVLTLRVDPPDAQVLVDGEAWLALQGRRDLVIHVPAGAHTLEVRREGYQTFKTGLELAEGGTTTLNVTLAK